MLTRIAKAAALAAAWTISASVAAQDGESQDAPAPQRAERRIPRAHPELVQRMPPRPPPPSAEVLLAALLDTGPRPLNVVSVRLREGAALAAVLFAAKQAGIPIRQPGVDARPNALRIIDLVITGGGPGAAAAALAGLEGVEFAQVNWTGRYEAVESLSDPYYSYQWNLLNTGRDSGSALDADIDIEEAWAHTQGDPGVAIAVIDSGVEWQHPELLERLMVNDAEYNGAPNVDDDLNGFIDDIAGWDFDKGDNDPRGVKNHGTLVAGVISSATGNGVGISGIAGGGSKSAGCLILPLAIGDPYPRSDLLDDAILYAVARGVKVITLNLSFSEDAAAKLALEHAAANGVVVVCAAGNDLSTVSWPASEPSVIPVASTGAGDCASSFSNPGKPLTDGGLAAPGEKILSLTVFDWSNNTFDTSYGEVSGTSIAAPQVAAVAGLLFSLPRAASLPPLTPTEVRTLLRSTADPVGCLGTPDKVGAGRLNAGNALRRALGL